MSAVLCCPDCGLEYRPTESLHGICPGCLMQGLTTELTVTRSPGNFRSPKVEELAAHFPQLEIGELVGCGGMSAVYKVRQRALDRVVALKILPQEVAAALGGTERFHREARALARLNHPNIVALHEFGQAGPWVYFLMEFVDGPNMRQVMADGPLPRSEMLRCVQDLCDGLQYAHDQGVVHRDIKPENVLLDPQGRAKIADFGLAKLLDDTGPADGITQTHHIVGTPQYIAPERLDHSTDVDHRADVYSLGVLLYEMLTGELPAGHFEPPSRKSRCDHRLDEVVLRALAKEPHRRYQQARDVSGAVLAIASDWSVSLAHQAARWSRGFHEWILSGMSILAALLAVASLMEAWHWTMRGARPGYLTASLFLSLLSCVLARVNLSFSRCWNDLSPAQWLAAPLLIAGYLLFALLVLLMPVVVMVFLASVPLVADVAHWQMFGHAFAPEHRLSLFSSYWLTSFGIGAICSSVWTLLLSLGLAWRPTTCQMIFHPASAEALKALAIYLVLFALVLLAAGTALLCLGFTLP